MSDELVSVLASEHRRRVLVELFDHGETRIKPPDSETNARSRIELYHVHLPKLETIGLITWDRRSDRLTPGTTFEDIEPFLELMDDYGGAFPAQWPTTRQPETV